MARTGIETFITGLNTVENLSPIRKMIDGLGDSKHPNTVFFDLLNQKRKKSWTEGGDALTFNIVSATDDAQGYYGDTKITLSSAEYIQGLVMVKAYLVKPVIFHKTDLKMNMKSVDRAGDYVNETIAQAKANLAGTIEKHLLGNGTTDVAGVTINGVPCLQGLQLVLDASGQSATSAYGGKTRTATTYHLNCYAGTTLTSVALSLSTAVLGALYGTLAQGSVYHPTHIMSEDIPWRAANALAKTEKWPLRGEMDMKYDLGYPKYPDQIQFNGAALVPNKYMTSTTYGGKITTALAKIYMLNMDTWELWVDPSDDFNLEPAIRVADQMTLVQHLCWSGALVCKNPAANGVISYTS